MLAFVTHIKRQREASPKQDTKPQASTALANNNGHCQKKHGNGLRRGVRLAKLQEKRRSGEFSGFSVLVD